jgi:peptidoglycan hydrolase-like protein with peptidoglycan-binding domain
MGTAAGMIEQARKLLGTTEHPPGSNRNVVTRFFGFDGAWCEMSIHFEAAHSDNAGAMFGKFANTVAHARAFAAHGRWHFGLGGIRPGDVVYFDWSGTRRIANIDHVGLVEAVHRDGTITTLEGNTSNGFHRRRRNGHCIVGYGRPAYGDAAPMPASDGILRSGSRGGGVTALQRRLAQAGQNVAADGDFGAATKAAVQQFQKAHGLEADGEYGPATAAVLKAVLAGHAAPVAPVPVPPPAGTLAVDGEFGPSTCAALQRALKRHSAGLGVDGAFGPQTKRALQHHLQVGVDGDIGPTTVRALQKHVRATVDGDWGPDTTRHLQTTLNAGSF